MYTKHFNIWKLLIILLLVFLSTLLIFTNSLMDFEASHSSSKSFIDTVIPKEYRKIELMELIVRKSAHVIEYAFLGAAVMVMILYVKHYYKSFFGFACFYVLTVAVLDEYVQSFSDRTSSTSDILIDFGGALLGFLIGWAIVRLYELFKNHSKKEEALR